jgi:hypothetical protein
MVPWPLVRGVLYTKRMRPDQELIPVSEYPGTGTAWQY